FRQSDAHQPGWRTDLRWDRSQALIGSRSPRTGGSEVLVAVGRQIANQARSRGVSSQTVSTSTSPAFSQGFPSKCRLPILCDSDLRAVMAWQLASSWFLRSETLLLSSESDLRAVMA